MKKMKEVERLLAQIMHHCLINADQELYEILLPWAMKYKRVFKGLKENVAQTLCSKENENI